MKKSLLLLASAALLFAGCAKEINSDNSESGGLAEVEFNVGMADEAAKASFDYDGNAAKANHWIMEVRDAQGKLFFRDVKTPTEGTLTQTFKVSLIKNQSYNLLFWADNGAAYYDTDDLTEVALIDPATYEAGDDARDAFTACKFHKATASEKISVKLYRPFAQVNIVTTDLEELWEQALKSGSQEETYAKFEPTDYVARIKVPTSFNVMTQTCGAVSTQKVLMTAAETYTGYKSDKVTKQDQNNYLRHVNPATLYMDYIFASKGQNDVVDIDFEFVSNFEKVEYVFTSIPVQANYRTNIKGRLLSNETEFVVEIIPDWTDEYDVDVFQTTIDNIDALNEALASTKAGEAKQVTATVTMPSDSNDNDVVFTANNNDQTINLNFEGTLGNQKTITFCNDAAETAGPSTLNVTAPAGTKLVFNNPMTHVVINGTAYDNISGTFSANSLIISKGVAVKNLSIAEGGLEIHGTVQTVEVVEPKKVTVRACEGLSNDVYTVLVPYISNGFTGVEEGGKWNIVAGENWSAYAAKEYSKVDEATKTIELGSAAQLALLSNEVNAGKTYDGWTFKLVRDIDMSGHIFTPIGNYSGNKNFMGTFDGQNNNIKNINVYSFDKQGNGVFGQVYAPCVLKNINVINAKVTAEGSCAYTGGLVGHGYATIKNCKYTGEVHGTVQMGGIAASGGFDIEGCTFEGKIYGSWWGLGGIIGNCQDNHYIKNNTAKGAIIATGTKPALNAGGIIANLIYPTTEIKNNYSAMTISYNGEALEQYPVIGAYNLDAPGMSAADAENVLAKVADNTWDKKIYEKDQYPIYWDTIDAKETDLYLNYGAASTRLVLATVNGVEYATVEAAIEAASAGDVVTVYGTTEFTKADDGNCYIDAAGKTGRLVLFQPVSLGSATSNATFKISTDPSAETRTFQNILIGSESRLDLPGTLLKSSDVAVLPAKTFFIDDQGTIYDVYGDITFLGMAGKTVMKPWQTSGKSYRYLRIYNRYKKTVAENIIYHYNFKDMIIDGSLLKHSDANLFVVTCYNIQMNLKDCVVKNFPGSVFSIWANDTYNLGGYQGEDLSLYPTKADNVGVEVNVINSKLVDNGRLVHYDARPYISDIDTEDRYAFIHVNYDAASEISFTKELYGFNANTAPGQGNCLLNGVDVYPAE